MATVNPISQEERFLTAVRDGDVSYVEQVLENKLETGLDINRSDRNGKSALTLAVLQGNLLIIKLLLSNGARLGDALLRAVDTQFLDAVQLICKHSESLRPNTRKAIIGCHPENDDFHPDLTPIVLAAHHNNYMVLKTLLKYGERVPDPESSDFQRTEKHTLQRSVGTLNVYRALSSGYYISLTAHDPIGKAFTLSSRLKEMSDMEYEFRAEYTELSESVEQYAADILAQARDSEELTSILTHDATEHEPEESNSNEKALFKVFHAIACEQKKFVAHPHCQQLLIKRFYGQMSFMRDWSLFKQLLLSLVIMLVYPFTSFVFIFLSSGKLLNFLSTPYVKFLMDIASRMTFLVFLLITTIVPPSITTEDIITGQGSPGQFSQVPLVVNILILLWIIGMTWAEINAIWKGGVSSYLRDGANILDFAILALFWSYMVLTLISYLQLERSYNANSGTGLQPTGSILSTGPNTDLPITTLSPVNLDSSTPIPQVANVSLLKDYISGAINLTESQIDGSIRTELDRLLDVILKDVSCAGGDTSGVDAESEGTEVPDFDPFHPALVADAVFAIATVVTFLRLLILTVSSQLVGPLQISLGGMLFDIGKFIMVFIIVWFAFSLGLNQIYQAYQEIEFTRCVAENAEDCRPGPFYDVGQSMLTLFWSLFGLESLDIIDVSIAKHYFTEAVGKILFALYMMFAVVVMLNALIAMMSNTYTRVEENSDTEWKFARARMWVHFLHIGGTVPPPFNVIPTLSTIIRVARRCYRKCCVTKSHHNGKSKLAEHAYKKIAKLLAERYILDHSSSSGGEAENTVSRADVMAIRNDVAVFRYETFKSLNAADQSFENLQDVLGNIKVQLAKVDDIGAKTEQLDNSVKDLKERNRVIRNTVDGMASSLFRSRAGRSLVGQ
ncbi:short transient receptor potential channel 5-like isoform X1 [Asterias rubens]|uniref:short transient receptor potential channel 5-like isoform X1 n=2 Tax=Asterias rubens TaxID=7604 RepID=UPI001454E78D|nr:short transient receptor potential channel 5-like isoform X1 [Asterias rubens]